MAVFTCTVALLASGYVAVVRCVDPYGDFSTGHRRFPLLIWDSRPRKLELFQAYRATGPVYGILLGSSRTQKLNPQDFQRATGRRFFNFAVGSMMAEEYLATYRWVRRQGVHPRVVIIGLDVEALSNDDAPVPGFRRMAALNALLIQEHRFIAVDRLAWLVRIYNDAFTLTYGKATWRSIAIACGPPRQAKQTDYAPDGYMLTPEEDAPLAQGRSDLRRPLDQCFTEYVDRFRSMTRFSPRRQRNLEQVIREAQADGATVLLWITPIHPITAGHLAGRTNYPALLAATRTYLADLHETRGVRVYDFSGPEQFGGDLVHWADCAHVSTLNASRIAAHLIADLPR